MNPEPEQAKPQAEPTPSKKRTGVPVWRTGKPDAVLAASVGVARTAIEGIAKASEIGEHLAARTEGDRLVTHLFESKLPGYGGWQWYAVLTRNSRSKVVTVSELGLLPSEDSILAPEWVPWAERVRPEDAQNEDVQTDDVQTDAPEEAHVEAPAGEYDGGPAAEGAVPPSEPAGESDGAQNGNVQNGNTHDEDIAEADSPGRD
ncbi:DUF3027 domain-containing protein [Arthrobacter sp. NPDC093125]|uniref:DUF3027 domain-containing protein n=1 Tax=Arthrobacter sp. NPDC093125 TaxID=3363944 RepID=UPI00382A4084